MSLKPFWKNCPGGICAPLGFVAGAARAGLKKSGLDLAVLLSQYQASAAACFTQNRCPAAPVRLSREHLRKSRGYSRAVLVNSGCANAGTGAGGRRAARDTAKALARSLDLSIWSILVCSTGVIGLPLRRERLIAALPACLAALGRDQGEQAAEAISTTDTVLKIESLVFPAGDGSVRIGGIAKGAGMIHPDMATMLAFVTTDAAVPPSHLQGVLRWCVERSFNCITVDGDTSTNDTVIAMANGASGVDVGRQPGGGKKGVARDEDGNGASVPVAAVLFREALLEVCQRLARKIAWDGEGATHHLEIKVTGARSFEQARSVGRAIGRSNLVKTAIYGHDPNWGRILSAVGASGEPVIDSRLRLSINQRVVVREGMLLNLPDSLFLPVWKKKRIQIAVDLGLGGQSATCWSCDLSHAYIDINGSYRT